MTSKVITLYCGLMNKLSQSGVGISMTSAGVLIKPAYEDSSCLSNKHTIISELAKETWKKYEEACVRLAVADRVWAMTSEQESLKVEGVQSRRCLRGSSSCPWRYYRCIRRTAHYRVFCTRTSKPSQRTTAAASNPVPRGGCPRPASSVHPDTPAATEGSQR